MSNKVTYSIDLIPENAALIDQLNGILMGGETTTKPTSKESRKVAAESKAEETVSSVTLDELKNAAKAAKREYGDEFARQAIASIGLPIATTLGRCMGKIPEDRYAEMIKTWEAGPQLSNDDSLEGDDGLGDDDGLGEDEPAAIIDPEAVKVALKAYAKSAGRDVAKKVMVDNGVKVLSDVDSATPEQLEAIMKAVV